MVAASCTAHHLGRHVSPADCAFRDDGPALDIAVRAGVGGVVCSLRNWGLGSMGGNTPSRDASSTSSPKVRRTRCGCSNVRHPTTTRFSVRPVANGCPKGRTSARCADMTSVTTCRKARWRSQNTAGGEIGLRLLADESSAIDRVGVHPQSAGSALRASPNTYEMNSWVRTSPIRRMPSV
jgi:hypothetical protein